MTTVLQFDNYLRDLQCFSVGNAIICFSPAYQKRYISYDGVVWLNNNITVAPGWFPGFNDITYYNGAFWDLQSYTYNNSSNPRTVGVTASYDGISWSQVGVFERYANIRNMWKDIKVVHNGVIVRFNRYNTNVHVYLSTDCINWSEPAITTLLSSQLTAVLSHNGSLYAFVGKDAIYKSDDSGFTWYVLVPSIGLTNAIFECAMSGSGIVAIESVNWNTWVSSDFVNWTRKNYVPPSFKVYGKLAFADGKVFNVCCGNTYNADDFNKIAKLIEGAGIVGIKL